MHALARTHTYISHLLNPIIHHFFRHKGPAAVNPKPHLSPNTHQPDQISHVQPKALTMASDMSNLDKAAQETLKSWPVAEPLRLLKCKKKEQMKADRRFFHLKAKQGLIRVKEQPEWV